MLGAELNRRKEPLEAYPLDSMSMVGSVAKQAQPFALLRVDNLLYQVKLGDYLGQNYGRITKITETQIDTARNRAGRRWRMDRAPHHPAVAGEGTMKSTLENRIMHKWRATVAVLALALATAARGVGAEHDPVDHQLAAGRHRRRARRAERAAGGRARGLLGPGPAARGHRPARRGQWPGQELGRAEPGQPALGQRGPVRRAHAPGAEPAPGRQLPCPAAGQVADRAARFRRPGGRDHRRADAVCAGPERPAAAAARH